MRKFPDIRYFSDYYHHIAGLVDKSGIVINRRTLTKSLKGRTASITVGEVQAPEAGSYPDETALPFARVFVSLSAPRRRFLYSF